jgi:uncharacterized protein
MKEIQWQINDKGDGTLYLMDGTERLGEMVVDIRGKDLTVYHTEVAPEAEGKGLAKKLMDAMVAYARTHHLKVIPLCPYVHAQFKRHPELYSDIWKKDKIHG